MDWKEIFTRKEVETVGLDIGSVAVKMVKLRRNGDNVVVTAAEKVDIQEENKEDPNYTEDMNTVRAIHDCYNSIGVRTNLAVCSVSGPEVAVRNFKFPVLPREEIPGAVLLEAEQVCPFKVSDEVVDYCELSNGHEGIRGILVAATNRLIERKKRLATEATLTPVLMDVDGLALLNCLSEFEKPDPGEVIAVLNVGSSYVNLAIMGNNSLPFVRDISHAGQSIIQQIAKEKSLPVWTVREILFNSEQSDSKHENISESFVRACEDLISDVTKTLRFYAAQEKSSLVEKVFVCGGFAKAKGFIELLENRLPAKVVLWNPFEQIKCESSPKAEEILQNDGHMMVVAAGLAMRSI